jgi:hypothetical protein
MNASAQMLSLRRSFEFDGEPRSVAAFERRARAEALLLCAVAVLGFASVLVSVARMGALESMQAAATPAVEGAAEGRMSTDNGWMSTRSSVPMVETCEEIPTLLPKPRAAERAARGERELRAEYLAVADAKELALRVAEVLRPEVARAEQMAALQAAVMRGLPEASELCAQAALQLPLESNAQGESVPRALVDWLARRARVEAGSRQALETIAAAPRVDSQVRAAALRAWIDALPENELGTAATRFGREADDVVYASALSALEKRSGRAAAGEPE